MEIFALYLWMKLPVLTEILTNMSSTMAFIFCVTVILTGAWLFIERMVLGEMRSKQDDESKAAVVAYDQRTKIGRRLLWIFIPLWFFAYSGTQLSRMIPTQKETAALAAAYAAKVVIESESGQKLMNKLKKEIDDIAK